MSTPANPSANPAPAAPDLYYKLGTPSYTSGQLGVQIPISWSLTPDPNWQTVHSGGLIVNGFIDPSGELQIDQTALAAQINTYRARVLTTVQPPAAPAMPAALKSLIGVARKWEAGEG